MQYGRGMDMRVFTEPQQGASYDTQLRAARATEAAGFSGFFRSDHFLKMGDADGLPGPTDAWLTLAALGRETKRIALGTLVTSMTFRNPGVLAVSVAQADAMSGGRIELGLGAGWFEAEHSSYGIPFPSLGERFERLEEQLQIITGMWDTPVGDTFDHSGAHYTVTDSPALPKPTRRPPIIVGGGGPRRTPRLAATFADEFNAGFSSADKTLETYGRVREACEKRDRDPDSLTYSLALAMCCGESEAEIAARAANIGREVDELRENALCGTPGEIAKKIRSYEAIGTQRIYCQVLDLEDLDHIALIGSAVVPEVG